MSDIQIINDYTQYNHPDRMRIPLDADTSKDMHPRWTDKNNVSSREYDGWVKVQGDNGVIEQANTILLHKPESEYQKGVENQRMLNLAQMNLLNRNGIKIEKEVK